MNHSDLPTIYFDLAFLGGGQLARMSIQAAQRMGLRCLSLDPGEITPASQIAPALLGALDDPDAIAKAIARAGFITLENEFIPASAIEQACEMAGIASEKIIPGLGTLATIQDKLLQRQALYRAGVPSPRAVAVEGNGEQAVQAIGFPMVLKARFGGYDGKGTRYARSPEEFQGYRSLWGAGGWMAEAFVPFRRELAAMVYVEQGTGRCGAFPTMETVQENHVCSLVFPSGVDASEIAIQAVQAVEGVGLFGVELFELEDGSVQVNELAPRPHNTGHYTLDWGGLSQFDVHVRVVMGIPVPDLRGSEQHEVCMANLLGQSGAGDYRSAMLGTLRAHNVRFHWYGKEESRPGRKMGHLNAVGPNCVDRAKAARAEFYRRWTD